MGHDMLRIIQAWNWATSWENRNKYNIGDSVW